MNTYFWENSKHIWTFVPLFYKKKKVVPLLFFVSQKDNKTLYGMAGYRHSLKLSAEYSRVHYITVSVFD